MSKKEIIAGRGFYYMPSAFITLKVTADEKYNHEKMLKAIAYLEEVHPIINNVVRKSGEKMWFEEIGKHVSLIRYEEKENIKWEDVVLELTKEPVNLLEVPGVMICVIEKSDSFDLLVICHHIYADGIGLKCLADDLLYMYSTCDKLRPREALTELSEENLTSDYKIPEDLKQRYLSFAQTCKERQVEFSWEAYKLMIEKHNEVVGSGIVCRSIKGAAFQNLKDKCKEYGVTLNSVLTVAMSAALQKGEKIDAIIAVNTRPLFNYEEKSGLANFASCIQPTVKYDNSVGFWENTVNIDKEIKVEKDNKKKMLNTLYTFMLWGADVFGVGYYARYGMFTDMEVLMELRKTLGLNAEAETFDISNVGSADFELSSKNITLKDCYFMPNLMPACACTFGVASLSDTLTISLGFKKNLVTQEKAEEIIDKVTAYFTECF